MCSAHHQQPSHQEVQRRLACTFVFCLLVQIAALAQVPYLNAGPDSGFAQMDFTQMYLDQLNRHAEKSAHQKAQDKELIDSGVVSALDLEAPLKAVEEYNRARVLMKAQHSEDAIKHLRRAVGVYPKFVSAHIGLGLAYLDQDDKSNAKSQFELAAKLDPKFPGSFVRLGTFALSMNDFSAAQPELEKAASLRPNDAGILLALAYAQNGTHQYQQALATAQRVHSLDHKGMANVHYVAASAAMSLNDLQAMERELNFFVSEDPTNAFAPVARQNLAALAHNKAVRADGTTNATTLVASVQTQTFPNSGRLKAELSALAGEPDGGTCEGCGTLADATPVAAVSNSALRPAGSATVPFPGAWTIRTNVDQVTLFFAVSSHGHTVDDLQESDIRILDNNKPPEKVEQFAQQSKLPLRLALLIDTSGSVHDRFSFEKHAAAKFVEKMLSGASDSAFIGGFSHEFTVTQDFTSEQSDLGAGIEKLANGGGTALFDAVAFACRKLAAYPESERVARVLVILSDGEDNSSHGSLKQSIQIAEATGVTIYTISTKEQRGEKSDADRILEALAERSGGEAMFPGDILSLGKSFDKLSDLIRSRYFVAYKPADFQPDGSYRTITVLAEKNGKRLQVRARKGYHARAVGALN